MATLPKADVLHAPGQRRFFNPALAAFNALEIDVPASLAERLRPLVPALREMDQGGKQHELAPGLTVNVVRPPEWGSDICWISQANEATYAFFEGLMHELRLPEIVAPFVPHDREIRLYSGFFVTRSHCDELYYHVDWATNGNIAFHLMCPISENCQELGYVYRTARGEQRERRYAPGKAMLFGDGFEHSTGLGRTAERSVFLSMALGTDLPEYTEAVESMSSRQGPFFRRADGRFVDNRR